MPVIVKLDALMEKSGMTAAQLAESLGITPAKLSILKSGKARAIRFSTIEGLCKALECEVADILEYKE